MSRPVLCICGRPAVVLVTEHAKGACYGRGRYAQEMPAYCSTACSESDSLETVARIVDGLYSANRQTKARQLRGRARV